MEAVPESAAVLAQASERENTFRRGPALRSAWSDLSHCAERRVRLAALSQVWQRVRRPAAASGEGSVPL